MSKSEQTATNFAFLFHALALFVFLVTVLVLPIFLVIRADMSAATRPCAVYRATNIEPENSCVLVYNEYGHGSGAIVDVNKVLTARHVADVPDLVVETADGDVHGVVDAIIDPNSDAALLVIAGRFDETPLECDPAPLEVGDEIVVVGAPFECELAGSILSGHVVKTDAVLTYGFEPERPNFDVLDMHAGPGTSGGPVLRGDKICGIVVSGIQFITVTVPTEEFAGDLGL